MLSIFTILQFMRESSRAITARKSPAPQQVEEAQPALVRPGAEPGDIVVADMGAEPVPPGGMPGASGIHRQPGHCRKPCPPDFAVLLEETVLSPDHQPHHLPLRDRYPEGPQLCRQPFHRR